jgi:membrane-bound lytic murein transglycosylase A
MQLQGSGKVRMSDGSIRRFAYADQNGRPFLPPIVHNGNTAPGAHKLVVLGMEMQVDVTDDAAAAPTDGNTPQADGNDDEPASPLLRGFKLATTTPSTTGSITPAVTSTAGGRSTGDAATAGAGARSPDAAAPRHVFAISDPSYVFFRVIPDSPNGPPSTP